VGEETESDEESEAGDFSPSTAAILAEVNHQLSPYNETKVSQFLKTCKKRFGKVVRPEKTLFSDYQASFPM